MMLLVMLMEFVIVRRERLHHLDVMQLMTPDNGRRENHCYQQEAATVRLAA